MPHRVGLGEALPKALEQSWEEVSTSSCGEGWKFLKYM